MILTSEQDCGKLYTISGIRLVVFDPSFLANVVVCWLSALLCYDTILRLQLEIELIWRKGVTLAAVLYGMAHYGAIVFFILNIYVDSTDFSTIQVIFYLTVLDVTNVIY